MPLVTNELREKRIDICRSCPHYVRSTKSCGPLGVGKTVTHEDQDHRLCGCVMPIKATLKIGDCPLGKWETKFTQEDLDVYKEFKSRYGAMIRPELSVEDQRNLKQLYGKAYDTVFQSTNCRSCWAAMIKAMDQFVMESEHRLGQSEPEKKVSQ